MTHRPGRLRGAAARLKAPGVTARLKAPGATARLKAPGHAGELRLGKEAVCRCGVRLDPRRRVFHRGVW